MQKSKKIDYSLYLVTDESYPDLLKAVEQAIKGGSTIVQLREKNNSAKDFLMLAEKLLKLTKRYNVPLIINDRVDIALAVDAPGVHLGQNDIPINYARKILGKDKIIGISVSTKEEAILAEKAEADYLGVGAMFQTNTKDDAKIVSFEELLAIRKAVKIPIIIIGGINERNISSFSGIKINGCAVVSAILGKVNKERAASELKSLINKIL